jgi:hypothetical protein
MISPRFLCVLCVSAVNLFAADAPKITYSKSFPKSVPAYVEISVGKDGHSEYKEAPDDESPLKFQLSDTETAQIFELADRLGRFSRPLESNLKVAFTGTKTFRWEDGSDKREVKFNYSLDPAAQQLWDWFERITESELNLVTLERAAKFDKLGVNQALLNLEASRDRNRLVAAPQFLPLLDRIVKNESYLHMARERAASLAEAIRNPKPPASQ